MAVILVTGANGQLGSELKDESKNYYGYDFIFTDLDTLDICNAEATRKFIGETKPGWIINCAAYNFVDKAEGEPEAAMAVNSGAVRNIARAIQNSETRLIHISTDYVYGGDGNTPCSETQPAGPRSAYARSKADGEKQALQHPGSVVIRTSWLYSAYGNNFVKTIIRHGSQKEVLKVVYDQTGSPTYAADLAAAILGIVSGVIRNQKVFIPGIFNYSNEGVCSWYDFATEIVREAGLSCRIEPILSGEYPTAAVRPVYSVMDKTRIKECYGLDIPHWRTSLEKCMKLLKK